MINGLEGIPGSGKSYEAVVYHVLEAVKRGRKVITNLPLNIEVWAALDPRYVELIELRYRCKPVRGRWDANNVDDKGSGEAFMLFEDGRTESASDATPVFGSVWDFYDTWRHPETKQGALFIIDECHVALPKMGTAREVVQWFKLHRHFNQDVLLMTQSFRDIASEIAGLLAMLIRCRKADILGRKDAYIRKVFSGFRGSEVSREERKYLPQYFQLYRSHTQGMSVGEASATDVKPFIVKWRRFTWAWWVFAVVFAVWAFWPSKGKPVIPRKAQAPVQRGSAVAATGTGAPVIAARGAGSPAPAASQPGQQEDPEPYAGKDIHIAGRLVGADGRAIYVLTVSDKGRRLFDMTAQDLKDAGYSYEALNACAGYVRRGSKARAVTCDAPILAAGSNDRPIVVGQPVAVSDRRGMATGLPSGEGGGGVVVVGAGSAPVWGYDPDKASAPVQSVFSRSSGK